MAAEKSNIMMRYAGIVVVIIFVGLAIVFKASKTIFVEGAHWRAKADSLRIEDLIVKPNRGNILATDGRLMASSIPRYYVYYDFMADGLNHDTLMNNLPKLCSYLATHFPDRNASQYREHILLGYKKKSRQWQLIRNKISYTELKELRRSSYFGHRVGNRGFYSKFMVTRKKPFGSLASRTIGDIYGEYDKGGKNGVELAYDSLLRGIPGISSKQKVRGRWVEINEVEPIDGMDVRTTIDIEMQDITESSLYQMLQKIDAESGTAVVMEVKTGEIKAITNMARIASGQYAETKNHAVADEMEPGSTFKVASMMVALENGVITPNDTIDVGGGVWMYAGSRMTDHNWNKGGYGRISASQTIWYSSNIGVAKIILKGFEKNPEKYVDGLYKMGLGTQMELDIPGAGRPKIKHPITNKAAWSRTSLPWMSFGYETQIPPIYTLSFFNAIANKGEMVKPLFVKEVSKNGKTIETKETETIVESICSKKTLTEIHQMLVDVVENGTASAVKSPYISIAGKTGTAQIAQGSAGYKGAGVKHVVSFCGYFPADDPLYSCIVVIRSPRNGYPSGGTMAGGVFRSIAEQMYAYSIKNPIPESYTDTLRVQWPYAKNGNYTNLLTVLDELNMPYDNRKEKSEWVKVSTTSENLAIKDVESIENLVPPVLGMGARDAVYLLENAGLRVNLAGSGRVAQQSLPPNSRFQKGQTIGLTLK